MKKEEEGGSYKYSAKREECESKHLQWEQAWVSLLQVSYTGLAAQDGSLLLNEARKFESIGSSISNLTSSPAVYFPAV